MVIFYVIICNTCNVVDLHISHYVICRSYVVVPVLSSPLVSPWPEAVRVTSISTPGTIFSAMYSAVCASRC